MPSDAIASDPPKHRLVAGEAGSRTVRSTALGLLRDYGILPSFVLLFLILTFASEPFFTTTNLLNILDQQAPVLIIAAAGTLVIITGNFDISVGAVAALTGVVAAIVARDVDPWLGMAAGAGVGLFVGLVIGGIVTFGRIASLIVTLAMIFVIRGLAILITDGTLVSVPDERFGGLANDQFLGVNWGIWVMAAFVTTLGILLAYTRFGRHVYAVGGNAEAARLAGVRVDAVRSATFALSGLSAGIAGVIIASRASTGQSDAGVGLELGVIAGIVVGGTSIFGGMGAVWRTVIGVLFIALIGNGFNLLGVDPTYQQIIQGLIILAALLVDSLSRRES